MIPIIFAALFTLVLLAAVASLAIVIWRDRRAILSALRYDGSRPKVRVSYRRPR